MNPSDSKLISAADITRGKIIVAAEELIRRHGPAKTRVVDVARHLGMSHANTVHDEDYVTTLYHGGRAYLRQGMWKISNLEPPFDEANFELFDLATDPGESVNLADDEPEKLAELIELWRVERKKLGIILPQDL